MSSSRLRPLSKLDRLRSGRPVVGPSHRHFGETNATPFVNSLLPIHVELLCAFTLVTYPISLGVDTFLDLSAFVSCCELFTEWLFYMVLFTLVILKGLCAF